MYNLNVGGWAELVDAEVSKTSESPTQLETMSSNAIEATCYENLIIHLLWDTQSDAQFNG